MLSNKLASKNKILGLNVDSKGMIRFMKLCEISNIAPDIFPDIKKNVKQSTEWRNEGNRLFLTNPNDELASELYNKSIAYAPKGSIELSIAHAHQSMVLFNLKKYEECLQAIESCLSLKNYPEHLKLKILLQKTECLVRLNKNLKAKKAYEETENWIKTKVPAKAQLEKLNQLNECFEKDYVKQKIVNIFDRVMKELNCSDPNKEVLALANAVALKYNAKYGRHLVATRYIKPGEIIGKEKMYGKTLFMPKMYSHCWYCADKVWNCIPCDHCVNVIFCSEKCRDEAWKSFHDVECEVLKNLMDASNSFAEWTYVVVAGIQTTIKAIKEFGNFDNLRKETIEIDKCKDPRIKGFSKDGMFRNDSYKSYYTLYNSAERSKDEECMMTFMKLGIFACYILATKTTFFGKQFNKNWSELYADENILFMSQLVTKNIGIFINNAFHISEDNGEKCQMISPTISLINHSCNPNIEVFDKDNDYYALAVRPIEEGEQIFFSYINRNQSRETRRDILLLKYGFVCDCIACEDDWTLVKDYPKLTNINLRNEINNICVTLRSYTRSSVKYEKETKKFKIVMRLFKLGCDAMESLFSYISTPCYEEVETLKSTILFLIGEFSKE